MASFRGTYESTVVKGRIKLPKKLRDVLATFPNGRFVLGYSWDGCLAVFSETDWEKEERKLMKLDYQLSDHRRIQRESIRRAEDISFDQQGRCTLPQTFLDDAQIKEEVLIFGAGKWLEFWNPEVYHKFNLQKESEEPYEQVVEKNFRRKV
jgi:division/cell wall cluster transcriptional repressor MraZ